MAARTPVVASDIDGYRNVVTDGENGVLVPAGDAAALAHALREVTSDSALAERIVAGGIIRADSISMRKLATRYLEIYRDVLVAEQGERIVVQPSAFVRYFEDRASGKTIVPGFIDTHSHMWPTWGLNKNSVWIYAANFAYGVTTTRDPQTATTDVLTYGDMVEGGMVPGPRVYSTGPGVGYWMYNLKSLEQTKNVLKQYSKYYNTQYIKMYLVRNRQHRQWVIMAAKKQQLMPTIGEV